MTTQPTSAPACHRRSRLAMARDLFVAGLALLLVAGFLFDVAGGVRGPRPSAPPTSALST